MPSFAKPLSVRAIFFGTPALAVPALNALTELAEVVFVVCQPDRPSGRGLLLKPPPVKVRALELGLPVLQPEKIRTPEFAARMRSAAADVGLVIAYGRILPTAVLEAPRRGCMNLHASLLPHYRGAAPITWAIVRGETETGISLMQMDEGCDTGPVFTQHRIPIGETITADDLGQEIGELGARVVASDLVRAVAGTLTAVTQDHGAATMAPLLKKEDGRIDWTRGARMVHDHIRGMTSWPGAFTSIPAEGAARGPGPGGGASPEVASSKGLKVLESRPLASDRVLAEPGTVIATSKTAVEVACGTGAVEILRAQVEGRKPLRAAELLAGRAIHVGMVLGT